MNLIDRIPSYRAVNILRLGCKPNQSMLDTRTVALFSKFCAQHNIALCGQNVELI